jgi:hypothetical protein
MRVLFGMIVLVIFISLGKGNGSQPENLSTGKEITISVPKEMEGADISVHLMDKDSFVEVLKINSSDAYSSILWRADVEVSADTFTIKIVVGGVNYVFDVEAKQGMECMFSKSGSMVTFYYGDSITAKCCGNIDVQYDIFMRLHGNISGKHVELFVDSCKVLSERITSDIIPVAKVVKFRVYKPIFEVKIVIDGKKSCFDIDMRHGKWIDFYLQKNYQQLDQYFANDEMPGIM